MSRPPNALRPLAERLARELLEGDGLAAARLLRLTAAPAAGAGAPGAPGPAGRVGIWRRDDADPEAYTRDPALAAEWHQWADLHRIPPKGARRRVLLLGESVARGYLYDPLYNPARALEAVLARRLGPDRVEVLDLARISIRYEIRDVALAALALQPDALVMFCGNNWGVDRPAAAPDVPYLAAAVLERGFPGLREHAERAVRARGESVVAAVAERYAAAGVPVLWIVPEFNLADWRDPVSNAPHLPGDGNREWLGHERALAAAIRCGDLAAAGSAARRLVDLDGGTTPVGHLALAECAAAAGDDPGARAALERARDACLWDASIPYAPRCHAVTTGVLRAAGRRPGQAVLDSPALFAEHLGGTAPDRRLFLDYCHLTAEGIQVTVAAVAAAVLGLLGAPAAPYRELLALVPAPPPAVASEAHFLAAVHNAHWWQGADVVRHHIEAAVRQSAHIVAIMIDFLELQARRAPLPMGRAAERVAERGSELIQRYLFEYNRQQLDPLLAGTIADAVAARHPETRRDLVRLWIAEHGVAERDTDLLERYYSSAARQPHDLGWVTGAPGTPDRHYHRAFTARSAFTFVAGGPQAVELALTCRSPHADPDDNRVAVLVNGSPVAGLALTSRWARHTIGVAPGVVHEGLNEVTLRWPPPRFPGDAGLARVAEDYVEGRVVEPRCGFGDIHAFTASPGRAG
ncbi:hypothetical protein ACQP2P_32330 [Dactylosporangium sp. CA-139114]|uniref:hypothetical protein n=1 Tax=Dactylosporangium sp. CA-139114 TaxID=3239931 RepID=UPI003D97DBFA